MSIQNFTTFDPLAAAEADDVGGTTTAEYVHIRIQQRNGRKSLTTVQGINPELDLKKILKVCKKRFNCNGTIQEDDEHGQILQLQGDQRRQIAGFLIEEGIADKDRVRIHGF